jgi:hypothetical protein
MSSKSSSVSDRSPSGNGIPLYPVSSAERRCGPAFRRKGQRHAKEPPDPARSERPWWGEPRALGGAGLTLLGFGDESNHILKATPAALKRSAALEVVHLYPDAERRLLGTIPIAADRLCTTPRYSCPERAYSGQQIHVVGRHQGWPLSQAREARATHHRVARGGHPRPHHRGCVMTLSSDTLMN